MLSSHGVSRRRFFWASAALCTFLLAPFTIQATPPTGASERCQVILKYEGLCGNKRPNTCSYWDTPEHTQIGDNYWELCVNNTTPAENRYSHECISYYGLNSTCTSTVEDLLEYHAVTTYQATAPLRTEPQAVYVANTQYVAYMCGLMAESRTKIDSYYDVCGDVAPASCSDNATLVSNYSGVCGSKKPCQCFQDLHCSASYCAAPPPPPEGGSGGSGGGTDSGDGGGSGGTGGGSGGAPDVAFSAPIGDQGTGGSGSPSNHAASGGGGKSGCALGASAEDSGSVLSWALLCGWIALLGARLLLPNRRYY